MGIVPWPILHCLYFNALQEPFSKCLFMVQGQKRDSQCVSCWRTWKTPPNPRAYPERILLDLDITHDAGNGLVSVREARTVQQASGMVEMLHTCAGRLSAS